MRLRKLLAAAEKHLLTAGQIAERLEIGHDTVLKWAKRYGDFPTPVLRVGPRAGSGMNVYLDEEVENWMARRGMEEYLAKWRAWQANAA